MSNKGYGVCVNVGVFEVLVIWFSILGRYFDWIYVVIWCSWGWCDVVSGDVG